MTVGRVLSTLDIGLGVFAYFLGSIPFGLIVSRFKNIDIRNEGSKNIGATNIFRVMGWKYGVVVFFLDAVKGYIPAILALSYSEHAWIHILVGAMAVVGHSLTIFGQFKGGKGVATSLGVLYALSPDVCLLTMAVAFCIIAITRYVSLASVLGSICVPILLAVFDYPFSYVVVMSCLSVLIIVKHRTNIKRLIQGNEHKI